MINNRDSLNSKIFDTEMFSEVRISKPFLIGAIIHDLVKEEIILKIE